MLIFGPYRSIPKDESFIVYNLSSPTQAIARLPGLFVTPNPQIVNSLDDGVIEKQFDYWYYDYVFQDFTACTSLMMILGSLYEGAHVYICISDPMSGGGINVLNESFMKLIQSRYGIKYSIINEPEDYLYIPHDGCDFMTVDGIKNFDSDRNRYMQIAEENRLASGGAVPDPY